MKSDPVASTLIDLLREFSSFRSHCADQGDRGLRHWLFRGTSSFDFSLDPKLLRYRGTEAELARIEHQARHTVLTQGTPYLASSSGGRESWAAMFIMQHHGFPTRLLDWTESLACAAFFSAQDSDTDGALWMMCPGRLHYKLLEQGSSYAVIENPPAAAYGFLPADPDEARQHIEDFFLFPALAICPDHLTERIVAQRSRFTVHSFERGALEAFALSSSQGDSPMDILHKVRIPRARKRLLLEDLRSFAGIDESTLFPGLDGLARAFALDYAQRLPG